MTEVIYGRIPVLEALKKGQPFNKILIRKGLKWEGNLKEIVNFCREKNILFLEVEKKKLDILAKCDKHQGVIGIVSPERYVELEEILNVSKRKNRLPFIALLEGVEDPRNLGAIIRTAEGAGVDGIVIPSHRSVSLTGTVAKCSAGAVFNIPVAKVKSINNTISYLKKEGIWIVGLDMNGEVYHRLDFKIPLCIVIGGEGKGLSKLVKDRSDFLAKIPMFGKISSLNVAVASAIIFYEVVRQREIV